MEGAGSTAVDLSALPKEVFQYCVDRLLGAVIYDKGGERPILG